MISPFFWWQADHEATLEDEEGTFSRLFLEVFISKNLRVVKNTSDLGSSTPVGLF